MSNSQPKDQELLKSILEPLFEDFQYWFSRSEVLLNSERLPFLSLDEQNDLLSRLKQAQQEVATARLLFKVTGEKVGIESKILVPWHKLVAQCWQVSREWRSLQKAKENANREENEA
ncbi:MAG: hypothetical protein N5P05_000048 [Chroococcopsis gigantea SAG 12.99]|jgi:hypothetical protein|nr:DUF2605 domain-containing protein [Chlorogloea purpurea SAG 13.99]MDV2998442.1 hypothetical protein [Chroococcopsis gigantea SAG 12.99]